MVQVLFQHWVLNANVQAFSVELMGTGVAATRMKGEGVKKNKGKKNKNTNFEKGSVLLQEMLVNTSLSKICGKCIGEVVILNLLTEAF